MKKIIRLGVTLIILVSILYFSGTIKSKNYLAQEQVNIPVNPFELPDLFRIDSLIGSVRYLQLKTDNETYFSWIYNLHFLEDKILLFERDNQGNKAFLLTQDGKLITKIGNKGRGPGEYSGISDIKFNPYLKSVDLLASLPKKIMRYEVESGKFMGETSLEHAPYINQFSPYDAQHYMIANHEYFPSFDSWNSHFLLISRENGSIVNQYLPFKDFEKFEQEAINLPLTAFYPSQTGLSGHYFNSPFIYNLSNKELAPKYFFEFKGQAFVSNQLIDKKKQKEILNNQQACCFNPLLELENYIVGNYRFRDYWGAWIIYSKETGKTVEFADRSLLNPINGLRFRVPQGFNKDELVFTTTPEKLARAYRDNKNFLLPKYKTQLKEFISQMDKNGNQILVFYQLKDF